MFTKHRDMLGCYGIVVALGEKGSKILLQYMFEKLLQSDENLDTHDGSIG